MRNYVSCLLLLRIRRLSGPLLDELLNIFPEARASTPDSRANSTTPAPKLAGYPYLTVFRDTVRIILDKKKANDATVKVRKELKYLSLGYTLC